VNTLTKDLEDPNPAVRSTAVTAICSLPVLLPHASAAIGSVRTAAVTGVAKLWRHSPQDCHSLGLVDKLYQMLRDPEPTVVTFSIQTLNVVLAEEGGIVINSNMVKYFLSRIEDYKEKELCFLLGCLAIPDMDDQLKLKMLNTLDPFLDKKDGTVVLTVAKLLVKVVENQDSLRNSLVCRMLPIVTGFLKSSHKEFSILVIDFLSTLSKDYMDHIKGSLSVFHLKNKDSEKLKSKKIKFFKSLVDEDNVMEIVNYLFNLLPLSSNLNRIIIQTIADISVKEPSCYAHCVSHLQLLLKAEGGKYLLDVLSISSTLGLHRVSDEDMEDRSEFVATILDNVVVDDLNSSMTVQVLQLIQKFCPMLPESPYYFEDVLDSDMKDWNPEHYCLLLSCCVTLLMKYPATMQPLAVRTFNLCSKQSDHQLQENIAIYFKVLQKWSQKSK